MEEVGIEYWLKVLEVGLISSVKFLLAPFEAERYHFTFWESFAITTIGGIIGIYVFYYAGSKITIWWRHLKALLKAIFVRKPVEAIEHEPRKIFTKGRRFIIGIKMKFGLFGVAFITPCIISIPVGTIVAANFYKKRKGVLLYFIVLLVLWSLLLNGIAQYLQLSQYIVIPK